MSPYAKGNERRRYKTRAGSGRRATPNPEKLEPNTPHKADFNETASPQPEKSITAKTPPSKLSSSSSDKPYGSYYSDALKRKSKPDLRYFFGKLIGLLLLLPPAIGGGVFTTALWIGVALVLVLTTFGKS